MAPNCAQLTREVDLHGLAGRGCSWRQPGKAPPALDNLDGLSVFEPRRHSSEIIAKVSHGCGFAVHDRLIYHGLISRQVGKADSLQKPLLFLTPYVFGTSRFTEDQMSLFTGTNIAQSAEGRIGPERGLRKSAIA
jgi:hypothetical protein